MKRVQQPVVLANVAIRDVCSAFYRAITSDFRTSFASYSSDMEHDDRRYISRRLASEGQTFVTGTMPILGRCLNESLATGVLCLPSHIRCVKNTRLPKLFHTIWCLVYTPDGQLRAEDSLDGEILQRVAIRALRQVFLAFSKLEVQADSVSVSESIRGFVARTSSDAYLEQVYGCIDSGWESSAVSAAQLNKSMHRSKIVAQASRLVDHLFRVGNAWDRICPVTRGPIHQCTVNSENMDQVQSTKGSRVTISGKHCNMSRV